MAFAVPLIGAFAAAGGTIAGVGAALAGASGFAAFAGVAGGLMASAGILTGNKSLTKIGGILGLAGAVTGIASSLASGASEAAGSAASSAAGDAAGSAASDAASSSATEALKNEMANSAVGESIGQVGSDAAQQAGSQAGQLSTGGQSMGGAPLSLDATPGNLLEQARYAKALPADQVAGTLTDAQYAQAATSPQSTSFLTGGAADPSMGRLVEAGQQIKDKTALDTILDKLNGAGQWIKNNKEVAQVGGQLLAGGMQSYQQGQQFDAQMNLLAQRRARLNNPVVLGIQTPQLKTFTPGG